jgi:dinuclear metal center YbgI/SA1388 family protein
MRRDDLLHYLDVLLDAKCDQDYGPNGLQVEGNAEISRVVTGVSACEELFVRARELQADAVMVHHGLFWDGAPRVLTGIQYRRVRQLIEGGINLFAYHLPLDRHPELGNNALAARAFGLADVEPFAEHRGLPIGFRGTFPEPIAKDALIARCHEIYGQAPLVVGGGPDLVRTLGIVSGGAQKDLHTAIAAGLDAFLTGEASEWVANVARESGIHYFAAGHYATEVLGIRRLGEYLAERLGLDVTFVDVPNPI